MFNSKLLVYQNVKPLKPAILSHFGVPKLDPHHYLPLPTITYHCPHSQIASGIFSCPSSGFSQGPATLLNELRDCGLNLMPKAPWIVRKNTHLWRASGKWKISETENWQTYGFNPFFCPSFEDSNDSNVQMDLEATATRACLLAQNSDADQLEGYTPKHPETQAGHAVFCSRGSQVCRMSMQVIKGHRLH